MTFFLVIDLVLRIFSFYSHIFRMFTMLNVVMTISSQENHHFSLCSYFHAHPTTLLLKIILGDQCIGRPPNKFWGDRPPSPPRSPPLSFRLSASAFETRTQSDKLVPYLLNRCAQ